ncbi:hypothetical protein FKP32DRAFT_232019 [Trametes sanguinea]|nr:hypothetical protein FKP32DRAFT_232019 [Trametes sanguinea]
MYMSNRTWVSIYIITQAVLRQPSASARDKAPAQTYLPIVRLLDGTCTLLTVLSIKATRSTFCSHAIHTCGVRVPEPLNLHWTMTSPPPIVSLARACASNTGAHEEMAIRHRPTMRAWRLAFLSSSVSWHGLLAHSNVMAILPLTCTPQVVLSSKPEVFPVAITAQEDSRPRACLQSSLTIAYHQPFVLIVAPVSLGRCCCFLVSVSDSAAKHMCWTGAHIKAR